MFFSIFYLTPEKYVEMTFYLEVILLLFTFKSTILTYSFVIITTSPSHVKNTKKKSSLSNNK